MANFAKFYTTQLQASLRVVHHLHGQHESKVSVDEQQRSLNEA
jgi:hypothetical protein